MKRNNKYIRIDKNDGRNPYFFLIYSYLLSQFDLWATSGDIAKFGLAKNIILSTFMPVSMIPRTLWIVSKEHEHVGFDLITKWIKCKTSAEM